MVLRFNFRPGEEAFAKPWIEVVPSTGVIGPGESVTVAVSLSVTTQHAGDLNSGVDTLDDIIILSTFTLGLLTASAAARAPLTPAASPSLTPRGPVSLPDARAAAP